MEFSGFDHLKENKCEYRGKIEKINKINIFTSTIRTVIGERRHHTEYGMHISIITESGIDYTIPLDPDMVNELYSNITLNKNLDTIFTEKTGKNGDVIYSFAIIKSERRLVVIQDNKQRQFKMVYTLKESDYNIFINELCINAVLNINLVQFGEDEKESEQII